jgi:tRNA A37 threonylcarbamoyladenosine modification protein TsaB
MRDRYMYKIYIDTTKRYEKSVSLADAKTIVAKEEGDLDIVSTINRILQKKGVLPSDIKEVVPNVGPGSFTGIKVGVTIANVFNWALGKPLGNRLFKPEYGAEPNISKPSSSIDV